jgi:dihydrofolate reductase
MISIIVAIAENGAIGLNNQLIYHISADMKRFKALTTGNTVIMGRKTFLSLPKGALPNRRNIVLSRNPDNTFPGTETFTSIEEALAHCKADEKIYIIGGAEIYRQAFPIADELNITLVHDAPPLADSYFPDISNKEWKEVSREDLPLEEKTPYPYSFITYQRI